MKNTKWRNAAVLFSLIFIFAVGLLVFCKGFLLKRIEVPHHSECITSTTGDGTCNGYPRKFKRVIWLLIDALRYDFTVYDDGLDPDPPPYRNKLPFIRDLTTNRPAHAKLFRFVADPPTTTMQRLKAITTGGLPTFVDVSSNFNSYEISEDSLLRQIHDQGLKVTFMGDDTWMGLYDKLLTKSFYFPSFNVKDLHTVDNGVIEHLIPEIHANDADFIVGHFLGVDHCGHIFGPNHPSMAEKLHQMNTVIKDVVQEVNEDTIVFAFGDHGMTTTGDHGGESEDETGTALFVYSPRPLFCNKQVSNREISQIDLVPTVSLLLGVPIPFSSLGAVIPELFLDCHGSPKYHSVEENVFVDPVLNEIRSVYHNQTTLELLNILNHNSKQIEQYLKAYSELSGDFPQVELRKLHKILSNARLTHSAVLSSVEKSKYTKTIDQTPELAENMEKVAELYYEYIQNVKLMCRQIWAKFDDFSIRAGIAIAVVACLLTFLLNCTDIHPREDSGGKLGYKLVNTRHILYSFTGGFFCGALCVLLSSDFSFSRNYSLNEILNFVSNLCLVMAVGVIMGLLYTQWKTLYIVFHLIFCFLQNVFSFQNPQQKTRFPLVYITSVASVSLMALYSVALLSNSYILYEFSVCIFLPQTLLVIIVFTSVYALLYHHGNKGGSPNVFQAIVDYFAGCGRVITPHFPIRRYILIGVGIVIITRLSKLFRTCRDLQVDCTLSHLTLSLPVAMEMAGTLGKYRLALSFLSALLLPVLSALFVSKLASLCWSQKIFFYLVQPSVSFLVSVHWLMQGLDASGFVHLTHFQHVVIPRVVYCICGACGLWFVVRSACKKAERYTNHKEMIAEDSTSLQNMWRKPLRVETSHLDKNKDFQHSFSFGNPSRDLRNVLVNWIGVVLCVWQVLVMLHNDGLAMGACLMGYHTVLFVALCGMNSKLWTIVGEVYSFWPFSVYWCMMTGLYFHATGHEPTIPSIKFDAAFVGMHGEVESFVVAGILVAMNMLTSQIFFAIALPVVVYWTVLSSAKTNSKDNSRTLLFEVILQLTFCYSLKAIALVLAASLHRRHPMIWNVFAPRFLYEGAFFAVTELILFFVYIIAT